MEWKDLEKMTVRKLREEASKYEEIKGVHGKNKSELIDALAEILKIEKPHLEMTETVVHKKEDLKHKIKDLKGQRDQLIEAKNYKELHEVRREIHRIKRQIKKMEIKGMGKTKKK
jgi:hypothetical protein